MIVNRNTIYCLQGLEDLLVDISKQMAYTESLASPLYWKIFMETLAIFSHKVTEYYTPLVRY